MSSQAIIEIDGHEELEAAHSYKWSEEQLAIVKRTLAPDLTNDELMIFGHICHRVNLDPFARQIYAIKRKGKMCIQTGIDGFRLVAERTGKYAPGKDTEFLYDDNKKLIGAKAYVKKMTADGTWHDISATALLSEYNAFQGLWQKMPHVMIEKCAEARALRRAFPADLSGLYSDDEMEQAEAAPQPFPEQLPLTIDNDTAKIIDDFINGHDDIRKGLLKLCNVKSVYEIKESQLNATRQFVKAQLKIKNEGKNGKSESDKG